MFVFTDWPGWKIPLGFLIPFLGAKLDLTVKKSDSVLGLLAQIALITLAYALTGFLCGLFGGAVYNLISKYFGLQLQGKINAQSFSESRQRND